MSKTDRRNFIRASAIAAAAGLSMPPAKLGWGKPVTAGGDPAKPASAPFPDSAPGAQGSSIAWKMGLMIGSNKPADAIRRAHSMGFSTCQLGMEDFSPDNAKQLRQAMHQYNIAVTALVTGGPGPDIYNFYQGPLTCGLVPPATRAARIARLKQASDFAKQLDIPAVQTHCGFIPANPANPLYKEVVAAIREVASYCRKNGQMFRYETGQETPITMLRAIEDVGLDNQGINFDTGNFILYDTGNPVDALDVVGKHVQGTHMKDGLFPTNPHDLGKEVRIGTGKVDFPRVVQRLRELKFQGAITIEREISGPEQLADIHAEKSYLEKLIAKG
ncbi:MAG: sugar phosphate isomerase/epimerase family protein [Terriglobia bacterium]